MVRYLLSFSGTFPILEEKLECVKVLTPEICAIFRTGSEVDILSRGPFVLRLSLDPVAGLKRNKFTHMLFPTIWSFSSQQSERS